MERRRRLTDYRADALWDLRFTLLMLGRDAGFAVVSILILTLAIGANIAVFSRSQYPFAASAAISQRARARLDRATA